MIPTLPETPTPPEPAEPVPPAVPDTPRSDCRRRRGSRVRRRCRRVVSRRVVRRRRRSSRRGGCRTTRRRRDCRRRASRRSSGRLRRRRRLGRRSRRDRGLVGELQFRSDVVRGCARVRVGNCDRGVVRRIAEPLVRPELLTARRQRVLLIEGAVRPLLELHEPATEIVRARAVVGARRRDLLAGRVVQAADRHRDGTGALREVLRGHLDGLAGTSRRSGSATRSCSESSPRRGRRRPPRGRRSRDHRVSLRLARRAVHAIAP